ncbi:hypothetical protein K1T71_011751 [Dendrolimus kikuchii]|uniref:Uncharacterized protein n=1 Tax=Dendrolimus kikuchii TaxID=765133 RepID=A0ACC1CM90_9NEOP|nr:hypothetical protein K1T71_011751 [Dendrolimus kikuchii]
MKTVVSVPAIDVILVDFIYSSGNATNIIIIVYNHFAGLQLELNSFGHSSTSILNSNPCSLIEFRRHLSFLNFCGSELLKWVPWNVLVMIIILLKLSPAKKRR